MGSSLKNRYRESARTKDTGAGSGPFNLPSETKFYKPKEARNRVIILPFKMTSKKHPLIAQGRCKVGDDDYVMDVWVHQRAGEGEVDIVCLKKNYHKACPVCAMAEEYREQGKEEEYKALKPSRRVVYNILDARAPEKGVMVFMTSHYLFEKELIEEALASGDGGEPVDFADIENGKIISFRGSMTKIGNNEYLEYKSFSFEEREEPLPKGIEKEVIPLDECLKVLSHDEIEAVLYGQGEEDFEDKPADKEERSPRHRDEEEDRTARSSRRDRDEGDEDRPSRSSRRGDAEEVDEEKPSRSSRRDRDDEEKPADSKGGCPHGHKYPQDWDKKSECAKCKIWDKCGDALDALDKDK
jgi:hypothetical protein